MPCIGSSNPRGCLTVDTTTQLARLYRLKWICVLFVVLPQATCLACGIFWTKNGEAITLEEATEFLVLFGCLTAFLCSPYPVLQSIMYVINLLVAVGLAIYAVIATFLFVGFGFHDYRLLGGAAGLFVASLLVLIANYILHITDEELLEEKASMLSSTVGSDQQQSP